MKSVISVFPYLLIATFISISSISVHSQELAAHELNGDDLALSFDDIEYTDPTLNQPDFTDKNHEVHASTENSDIDNFMQNVDMYDSTTTTTIIYPINTDLVDAVDIDSSCTHNQHLNVATAPMDSELINSETPEDVISGDTGHTYIWTSDIDDTDNRENMWYGDPTQIPECVMGVIDDAEPVDSTTGEAATIQMGDDEEEEIGLEILVDDIDTSRNIERIHSVHKSNEMSYDGESRISNYGEDEGDGEVIDSYIPTTVTATITTDINSDFETSDTATASIDESIKFSQQQQDMDLNVNIEHSLSESSSIENFIQLEEYNDNNNEETTAPLSKVEEEEIVEVTIQHGNTAALLEQQERERLEKEEVEESEQQALFEMLAVQAELAQESYEQFQQESLDESVAEAAEHLAQEIEKLERLEKIKDMEIKRKEQKEQQSSSQSSRKANEHDKSWHSGLTSRISDRLRQFGSVASSPSSSQHQQSTTAGHGLGSASQSHTHMNSSGGRINNHNHQFSRSSSSSTSGGGHSSLDDLIHKSTGGGSNLSIQEKIQQAKMQSMQQQKEKNERYKRYKIPRQYARIVEQIIATYNDPTTTLYEVLGVTAGGGSIARSSSGSTSNSVVVSGRKVRDTRAIHDDDIRRAYRHMVFAVHPDRNPHPDAEKAFDYIQEAYEELINHNNRKTYDYSLFKQKQRKQIFGNWNKMQKVLQESVVNLKARALLFIYRVFRGNQESRREEYQELLGNRLADLSVDFKHYFEKIVLVPERSDRIQLVNELCSDYWKNIVSISFLIRLCLLPLI